ncbi:MAG: hypothetical protein Q9209_006093 [Squamulea sp. 1 TL-2023]
MFTSTSTSIPRLPPSSLRTLLLSSSSSSPSSSPTTTTTPDPTNLAIIDVRDADHIGGHIRSSLHYPSSSLDYHIPELVRILKGKKVVVFHCSLSQQRGPGAAERYLSEREKGKGVGEKEEGGKEVGEEKGGSRQEGDSEGEQEVYVLDGGFVRWQELYGDDESLTEGYVPDIWKDY